MTVYATVTSPLGELLLVGEPAPGGVSLSSLSMTGQRNAPAVNSGWVRDPDRFSEVARQLSAYFDGELTTFEIEFTPSGTDFQRRVWSALEEIPYGTTTTYGELARRIGVERGRVQALGAAIGANPLLLIRPCHRVIGADGSMRGYAGGVERKVQLLTHEGALQPTLV
ncbi:methylated-DNA--[protein]-cysteine S-methyltransferase [Streptomyces sp. NPDC051214]|uniref:methylated-DNA--[protein]-cysteine S-methyltransferase n=1 Tax=Streptomyces sp. NPDC051214 TaxID=3155282 RepID=UPI00341D901A